MAGAATTVTGTTGVTGGTWRGDVTADGDVVPWDGSAALRWLVAADDRWHEPAGDTGVRHRRVEGTAVFETRLRVPRGDAVQRVWSVADGGGVTVVEVANESSLPIACAFTRRDLLTSRPPTDVPVQGIDVPAGTVVVPVGHRSTVRVGLSHRGVPRAGDSAALLRSLPSSEATARGWIGRCDAASRLELPDAALVEAVRAARCELLLGAVPDPAVDPARFLLGAAELTRLAELDDDRCAAIVVEVAAAVERVARDGGPLAAPALAAADVVLAAAGEDRARRDLAAVRARLDPADAGPSPDGAEPDGAFGAVDVATIGRVEAVLASGGVLLPRGIPPRWLGQNLEVHGLVAGARTRLSLALRWHGPNVAVLWECDGDAIELTSGVDPTWSSNAKSGETLWRVTADR